MLDSIVSVFFISVCLFRAGLTYDDGPISSFSFSFLIGSYCVDGPSNIDDDEVSWSCEDCVPRIPQPVPAIRKSGRICSISDREVQRKKARRNWRNYSSVPLVEESNFVRKEADKVVDDESIVRRKQGNLKENGVVSKNERNHSNASNVEKTSVGKEAKNVVENLSNLDEKEIGISAKKGTNHLSVSIVERPICLGLAAIVAGDHSSNLNKKKSRNVERKQGKLELNGVASNNRDSEPDLQTRQNTMGLNSKDADNKNSSESSVLAGKKTEGLNNLFINGKDMQKKLEMNLDPQVSNGPEYCLESTTKADEIIDGDSVAEKLHKHEQCFSELNLSLLEEQQRIRNSEAAKQPDGAEEKVSDNIEATKAVSVSHQSTEKQPGFSVYELQTPKRKRRLVIAMEYSDSDEEPSYVEREHTQVVPRAGNSYRDTSSGEPLLKKDEYGLTQESLKSDDSFHTRQSPIQTDNYMLAETSSIGRKNHDIPQQPPVILDYYIPAQPMINAVWSGHCSISNHKSLSFGLEARLSNKAHAFVHGAACALPNVLRFEIMQKQYAWPKRFQESPPTADAIGLYFFPIEERDEKSYTLLLDEMIECDLALKFHINNLELLVYCSLELPLQERRFQTKYYMWGVFKRKQETSSTSQPSDNRISDTKYDSKDSAVPGMNRSSVSPSSVNNHSVINSSNSHLHYKARNLVELTPSIMLKHPKLANNEQVYNSQL